MPIGEAVQDEFLMMFFWNWGIYLISVSKLVGCNAIGFWGLFWYDDNGEMMNNCVLTGPTGAQADYILNN